MRIFRLSPSGLRVLRARVVEAASRSTDSDDEWLDGIREAWRSVFSCAGSVAIVERPDGFRSDVHVQLHANKDALGLVVHGSPGTMLLLVARLDDGIIVLERHQRVALEHLCFFLEGCFRLRSLGAIAELSREGQILSPDMRAEELWQSLVEGRTSLVEHGRRYRVVSNADALGRRLTTREKDILTGAARGESTKSIAFTLGISPPLVSHELASAAAKLGVATRTELVRIAAMLAPDLRPPAVIAHVTSAERAVLALVEEGLGNREIARMRGRSVRTIANQVASLLRKTGRGSRRALALPMTT